jgi:hypothetical protein
MYDTLPLYEEIDSLWPNKRSPAQKAEEKAALQSCVTSDSDAQSLKTKIEIKIEDTDSKKLPPLISLFALPAPCKARPVYAVVAPVEPEEEPVDDVVQAFEEILAAWPENEIKQNEKYARIAFVACCRVKPFEDVKKACKRYIEEMNNPVKASTHMMGIKKFVSDDDILDNWLQKASVVPSNYDAAFFDVAYEIYPEFANKKDERAKEESKSFYRRFVKEEEAVDFYCAVQSYSSNRKDDIKTSQLRDDYDASNDSKFTKKFVTFVRTWKQQPRASQMVSLLEPLLSKAFTNKGIEYHHVYPLENFGSAIGWYCQVEGEDGVPKGIVHAVTKIVEDVCYCLTTGKNNDNIVKITNVDYSIVSEVVAAAKERARSIPPVWKKIESE